MANMETDALLLVASTDSRPSTSTMVADSSSVRFRKCTLPTLRPIAGTRAVPPDPPAESVAVVARCLVVRRSRSSSDSVPFDAGPAARTPAAAAGAGTVAIHGPAAARWLPIAASGQRVAVAFDRPPPRARRSRPRSALASAAGRADCRQAEVHLFEPPVGQVLVRGR
jgi:hypothetical protein